jgi:hypothetical protein
MLRVRTFASGEQPSKSRHMERAGCTGEMNDVFLPFRMEDAGMKSVNIRIVSGMSACAGMLLCIVGCPPQQTQVAKAPPPPSPTVITKRDVDFIKSEYKQRLNAHHWDESTSAGFKELRLVEFRNEPEHIQKTMWHLREHLKKLIQSNQARIEHEHGDAWQFSIRYESDKVRGSVHCQIQPHHNERERLDLVMKVEESRR